MWCFTLGYCENQIKHNPCYSPLFSSLLAIDFLGPRLSLGWKSESEGVSGSLNPTWRTGWIWIWSCSVLATASCVALPMFLYFWQEVGKRSRPKAEPKSAHLWIQDLHVGMARFLVNFYLPCGQETVGSLHIQTISEVSGIEMTLKSLEYSSG